VDKLPKLKVTGLGWEDSHELQDFEKAKYFPFCEDLIIAVEGQVVNSYEDLVAMVKNEPYKSMPQLEVVFLPVIVGG
jgi:hypothetical protein